MRDCSSDLCSSDLTRRLFVKDHAAAFAAEYIAVAGIDSHESTDNTLTIAPPPLAASRGADWKSVVQGKSVSGTVDRGGRGIIKKKTARANLCTTCVIKQNKT